VHPEYRRKGYGKMMMQTVHEKLLAMGCPKINLNVRKGNDIALRFYEAIGYKSDDVLCLGKRLIED
jgi:ribosomal protein S18 acetylase RimI-like enzyme